MAVFVDSERWSRRELEVRNLESGEQLVISDNTSEGLDIADEIYVLTFATKTGIPRNSVAVQHGGGIGFVGREAPDTE